MSKILLKNVRLSFPHLFKKAVFDGKEQKFEATFLLHKKEHAALIKEIAAVIKEKVRTDLKGAKISSDKVCLRNGDEAEYEGYEGHMSLKASNNARPTVIDRDRTPLTEDDNKPYAGCYVNAYIELWAQNNQFGKRVNANLLGVQFYRNGKPFGEGGKTVKADEFEVFEAEDDDFGDDFLDEADGESF